MANCEVCGRPTASWFSRISHVECETVPGPWHVERGEFKSFDSQAMILLERGENVLALVKGCEIADAGRGQGGVAVAVATDEASDTDDILGGEAATDTDEAYIDEAEMEEALARVPVRETGCLHVTTRRICFVGKFDSKTIPLSEVVEVHYANDTLKIIAGDSRSATYSNLGSPRGLEIAAAVIRKLTQLALSKRRPKVRREQIKRPEWN
jgi:hypothetical protein